MKDELIKELKDYIVLLGKEIDSLVSMAYVHGWRSSLVEEGVQRRKRIEELENMISKGVEDGTKD